MKTVEDKLERVEKILASQVERRNNTMLENHAQTVIVFVILGVLSWVGYSILQTADKIAEQNVSMQVMKNDVQYMKEAFDKASSSHVDETEFRLYTEQLRNELSDTKARVRILEKSTGNPSPE